MSIGLWSEMSKVGIAGSDVEGGPSQGTPASRGNSMALYANHTALSVYQSSVVGGAATLPCGSGIQLL